jgi:TP901 family phage tail tape measure protein
MATQMRVPTVFTAIDRFSHVVSRMTGNVSAFGQTAQAAAMRTSRRMNSLGTGMLNSGAVMAVGLGYAVNEAMKYEKAIASLAAVTGTQVGSMNKYIEDLGTETKRSVIDIAKSFEIVGSKMSQYLDNPEALQKITRASILMADAAGMELEPAIGSLTQMMNIYRMSAEDAYKVVNKLSAGETVGSISIAQTADILPQFGAQAVRANVTIEESIALIQTLVKSLPTAGVGRGLRNILFDISSTETWDKNKWKAVRKAGVDFKFVTNNANDLTARLRELKKLSGTKGATELFFKRINSIAANTLFQNFDKEGFTDFLKKTIELNDANEKAIKNNATLAKKWMDFKASVQFLAIKIGTHLIPVITDLFDYLKPIIKSLIDWSKNNKRLIKTIAKITIGLLLLGVAFKIGAFFMLSYARALAVIEFATKAYTGYLWYMSLGFEGMAVATTYATAALWSFLWPLGLFALSIWVIIDMVQHWEDWYEIILLCVGPLGWVLLLLGKIIKHSDNIRNKFAFEGWSGGIKAIGIMLEDLILSPLIGIFNILGRLTSFIPGVGSTFTELAADLDASRHKIAPELTVGNLNGASQFTNFGGITPQWDLNKKDNLAGMNGDVTQQMMAMLAKGVIDINLNAPPGVIDGVDKSQSTGVRVNLGSTIGQRGNQNGY